MKDELKTIGVFAVCNTGGICVHAIDHTEEGSVYDDPNRGLLVF